MPIQENSYGSLDNQILLPENRPSQRRISKTNIMLLLNAAVFGIVVYTGLSVKTAFERQEEMVISLSQSLRNELEKKQYRTDQEEYNFKRQKYDTETYFKHTETLPSKFAVDHVTPLKAQKSRGTCWDFASIGILEQSYREQGIKHGWLQHEEYLALSEQAYGAEILRLCTGATNSAQQKSCRVAGNSIWHNSTEGGEAVELYYLVNGLDTNIFPHAICPYYEKEGHDRECNGLEDRRMDNPLRFTISDMKSYYDVTTAKRKFFQKKTVMTLTTAIPFITHYYPCIGKFANSPQCNPNSSSCTLCPPQLTMSTCCIPIPGASSHNLHGEFLAHRGMTIKGGHVMVLVGYNDDYRTKDGFTGGFILKNSWEDTRRSGSHSMQYWMREISDWEERVICPNSYSPYNWYTCGNGPNSLGYTVVESFESLNKSRAFAEGVGACLSEEAKLYAKINVQPLNLKCSDDKFCKKNEEYTYFLRNMTEWGDNMQTACMWEYHEKTNSTKNFCLTPMLVSEISQIFEPIPEEIRKNDPDRCGFYFYPYEVARQYMEMFEGFYVNSFDVKWHPQSYIANRHKYSHLNYDLVEKSTKRQKSYKFVGPLPYASVVKKEDLMDS